MDRVDPTRRIIDSLAIGIIAASLILGAMAVLGPGVYTSFYGLRISSRTLFRPLMVAVAATLFWVYRSDERQRHIAAFWTGVVKHGLAAALALAVLTFVLAFRVSAFEVYAADTYGYVSQAHLWAAGNLVQAEPLSLKAPWPEPEWTLSPLGYRPGTQRGTIVPIYAPGLPIVMAALLKPFGTFGPFLAVPLLGSVSIFAAFLLGRRCAGATCGLIAAALLLTSPIFLFQLKEPMSDVPVTAWWLLALVLSTEAGPGFLFAGGLMASMAILTRPNLVPLAAVMAVFLLIESPGQLRRRIFNTMLFSIGVVPGCLAVGILNKRLYGSPLASGYGTMSGLFDASYFWTNLSRYSYWLIESETPFILLALFGIVLLYRRERLRLSWLLVAFCVALYGCYALYLPFDNWTFLRFLLPGVALLLILCSVSLVELFARLPSRFARLVLAVTLLLFVVWRWELTGLQPITGYGRRFAVVADYVRDELPENAIVLSMIHSGSVRYYAHRTTLRWDWLPPEWLDRSLEFLGKNGYHPFLLIDDWERSQFTERFGGQSQRGTLNWTPIATYRGNVRTDLFDMTGPNRSATPDWIGEPKTR